MSDTTAHSTAETTARLAGLVALCITDREERIAELEAQLERAVDSASSSAVRVTELEAKIAELMAALERRNGQLAMATEAAESYLVERNAARATIDAVGRLIDPQD